MNKIKRLGTISMVLVAVLIFTTVFNVIYTGAVSFGGNTSVVSDVANASNGLKKSDMNFDSIREQYLNYQKVEKNTASFDGSRWIVVELEGDSLYDEFKKSTRYSQFTEYLKSVEGKKALASIRAKQSRFLDKLDRYGVNYTFKYNYSALTLGIALGVDASACNTISALSGVKNIIYSEHYAVPKYDVVYNEANVYPTGIYDTSDLKEIDTDGDGVKESYQGQGMAVAILDTGLDHTHEAFDPVRYEEDLQAANASPKYSRENIERLLGEKAFKAEDYGAGVNDLYYNSKVPFAYDYADDDAEVYPSYNNHGTHVAGIVAGKSDYDVTPDDKTDDETFVGVAPLAQLVICKVFTDDLYDDTIGGADEIDILAALEDCVRLGVDVINMSLGTSGGFSDEDSQDEVNRIYSSIREMGITLVCAASNDYSSGYGGPNGTNLASNPDSGTVGSPSTYFSAVSVASINGQKSKYLQQGDTDPAQVAFITNSVDGDGNRIEFIDELFKQLNAKYGQARYDEVLASSGETAANNLLRGGSVFSKTSADKLKLKYVLISGVGRSSNYTTSVKNQLTSRTYKGEPVDGTIALVRRGDTTFSEKVEEAMKNGADVVIIYNNVSGTINMSLGDVNDPVPTCLITMDASVAFVDYAKQNGNMGSIEVSYDFEAGPFMSDFSSWGPVSDLLLKPEITAHGGEITSAVPGAYDVLSGTSMASPNMAGAVAVLRQYIKYKNPELTQSELTARVNQVLMSTATIARNEEGNPYSPRKQGAGLAGIKDAVLSEGYITVKANKLYTENPNAAPCVDADGWLDKTKIELLDDPQKNGVYELNFRVWNTTSVAQLYKPTVYVMTETLASDNKTVAEKPTLLTDWCDITYADGSLNADGKIEVAANSFKDVKITVTLGEQARAYLEQKVVRQWVENGTIKSETVTAFENGMYVEGFVSLDNVTYDSDPDKDGVTLGVPYLAYYGDWSAAPLFDFDIYEVSDSEANNSVELEDKLKTTSSPTQVIGMYHEDDYIIPLGSYLYEMDEEEDDIYPSRDKIALSMYDEEGSYTVYELYAAYAGLLRNASTIKTVVTNTNTGEIVYEEDLHNVSKAYSAGGANRGAFVRYEINPSEWGWQNNEEFTFKVEGWLDVKDENGNFVQSSALDNERQTPWTGTRNTFEFPLTIDYEAPQILDYSIRFESYVESKVTKYRVYLDMSVYDNQYVMAVLPCYLKEETEGKLGTYLNLLSDYPIPVYGEKGSTTNISVEITDYYEKYGLRGDLYIQIEDYAMNSEVYNISLDDDSLTYPDAEHPLVFTPDSKLKKVGTGGNIDGSRFDRYELRLSPYELYTLNIEGTTGGKDPNNTFQNLYWTGTDEDKVIANEGEIYSLAFKDTKATRLYLCGEKYNSDASEYFDCAYAEVDVIVENKAEGNLPSPNALKLKPVHAGDNHVVNLDSGETVEVNPNTVVALEPYITPWYFEAAFKAKNGVEFAFDWTTTNSAVATVQPGVGHTYERDEAGNDILDEIISTFPTGEVFMVRRGVASITCRASSAMSEYGNFSRLAKTATFDVGEDYYVNSYYMYEWYGGEKVELPSDVNVLYIDEDCFKNDKTITEVILPPMLMEIPNFAFQGCTNLRKITISSQCMTIGPHAFDGCENLETVIFPEYVDGNKDKVPGYYGSITVGHYAFAGCKNLKYFLSPTGEVDDNGDPVYKQATRMTTMYDGAFAGCTSLESIDLTTLQTVGMNVFAGCSSLSEVKTSASTVIGPYMFSTATVNDEELACSALTNFDFKGTVLPEGAFMGCDNLTSFTFSNANLRSIGASALAETGLTSLTLPNGTYTVGSAAFANCKDLTQVTISAGANITFEGRNAFDGCTRLQEYSLGADANGGYTVIDGALYNAAGDTLLSLPAGLTTYSFPAGVTKIGKGAFSGSSIESIDLTNITEIGEYAFADSKLKSVTWPSAVKTIADGMFMNCTSLAEAKGFDQVTSVGAYAFAGCTQLASLALPAATSAGDYAFSFLLGRRLSADTNKLSAIIAPQLQTIGDFAFAGTSIRNAEYTNATSIGAWAFAMTEQLTSVKLGGVTLMGTHAFYGADALTTAEFGAGTKVIGEYAFSVFDPYYDNLTPADADLLPSDYRYEIYVWQNHMFIRPNTKLTRVSLPDGVTHIGAFAFTGQAGLSTLALGSVTDIGANAFRLCTALNGVDLTSAVNIGDYAFYGAGLTAAVLDNAVIIGDYAFAGGDEVVDATSGIAHARQISGGNISTLSMPKAERVGSFAFAGNKLQEVTIPATLNNRQYQFTENIYDKKGRVERSRERLAYSFGAGVFAYNSGLTKINVADGNTAFISDNGVLYAVIKDYYTEETRYELVQFPGGYTGSRKYTVKDNTTSIAASAFEGYGYGARSSTSLLMSIEFPYTVTVIGSAAFFNSTIINYTFNSVQAPVLIADNDPYANEIYKGIFSMAYYLQLGYFPWDISQLTNEPYLDMENMYITALYSNFGDYVFVNGFGNLLFMPSFNVTFEVPRNGRGYDSALYAAYAEDKEGNLHIVPSDEDMPDNNAYRTMEVIAELQKNFPIATISALTAAQLQDDSPAVLAVKAAREAYNLVSGDVQQNLVSAQYATLLEYEAAMRNAKRANGIQITLSDVSLLSQPTKTNYVEGELFDPTGMEIRVLYSDGSELRIKDDAINIVDRTIKFGERTQTIKAKYTDEFTGTVKEFDIIVNVRINSNPSGPDNPSGPSEPGTSASGALPTWAIAVIAVGAVLIAAGIAVGVALALKKKKSAGKGEKKSAQNDDRSTADAKPEESEKKPEAEKSEAEKPEDKKTEREEDKPEEEPQKDEPLTDETQKDETPTEDPKPEDSPEEEQKSEEPADDGSALESDDEQK